MFTRFIVIMIVVIFTVLLNTYYEVNYPKINHLDILTNKILDGKSIKILQISDYHDSPSQGLNNRVMNIIEKVKPHMIAITGDLLDEQKTGNLKNVNSFITGMSQRNSNIYFVTGNHEWKNRNKNHS